jgi:hypothetical protein
MKYLTAGCLILFSMQAYSLGDRSILPDDPSAISETSESLNVNKKRAEAEKDLNSISREEGTEEEESRNQQAQESYNDKD